MKILYHRNVHTADRLYAGLFLTCISFFCMFRITPAQEDIPDSGQTQVGTAATHGEETLTS